MGDLNFVDGESLLKTFKELDIDIGNLNPNVIKSWFDTDDTHLLNMLKWICSSLSQENILLPYELDCYENIKAPLSGLDLEKAVNETDNQHSNIFNADINNLLLEFSLEELNILKIELSQVDSLHETQQNLLNSINQDLVLLKKEEAYSNVKYNNAVEHCLELGKILDSKKTDVVHSLEFSSSIFNHYKFTDVPLFINQLQMEDIQRLNIFREFFDTVADLDFKELNSANSILTNNSTFMSEVNLPNNLDTIKNRIWRSQENLIKYQLTEEALKEKLNYLTEICIENLPSPNDMYFMELNAESRNKQLELLNDSLRQVLIKNADNLTSKPKILLAKKELNELKSTLESFTLMSKEIKLFLVKCYCAYFLNFKEFNNLKMFETNFLKQVYNYINSTMKNVVIRSNLMLNCIEEYDNFLKSNIESGFWNVNVLVNILSQADFKAASLSKMDYETKVNQMTNKIYNTELVKFQNCAIEMLCDANTVKKFLLSGPTINVELIPCHLKELLLQIKDSLKQQNSALQSIVTTCKQTKDKLKAMDSWTKKKRLLWVYFYENPVKMHHLIRKLEENLDVTLMQTRENCPNITCFFNPNN